MVLTFAELGLDDGSEVLGVAYHHLTGTVIVHTERLNCTLPKRRMFFRSSVTPGYQPIGEFREAVSVDSYLVDQCRPALYLVTNEWRELSQVAAGTWEALYRFDLSSHRCEPIITRESLIPPSGWQSCWLISALAMSEDGENVYCQAGLLTADGQAKYFIAKLDLDRLILSLLVELEAVFA